MSAWMWRATAWTRSVPLGVGRGELDGPVVAVAEVGDFVGVGGDEDAVELRAGGGGFEDPGEHGAPGDGRVTPCAASRVEARRAGNNAEDGQWSCFTSCASSGCGAALDSGLSPGRAVGFSVCEESSMIEDWLCRGDGLSDYRGVFVPARPIPHIGGGSSDG